MQLVLEQSFPLGRFHATPWRINPFDDPHGEWPPSPWRLVRAIVSRLYQLARETGMFPQRADDLCRALCRSEYSFYLPPMAHRCPPLRYYQPIQFGWQPPSRTRKTREGNLVAVPGLRTYSRGLVQDNAWAVPENEPLFWFLTGALWDPGLLKLLDQCLERILYFGRAESITVIRRRDGGKVPTPNSVLKQQPGEGVSIPILCPAPEATRKELEAVTEAEEVRRRTLPPGARWLYATRPTPEPLKEPQRPVYRPPLCTLQFALGVAVPVPRTAVVRLTNRFRGRAIRALIEEITAGAVSEWSRAPADVRERVARLAGKNAFGLPLDGHRHAHYLLWSDDDRHYTRLIVWIKNPFCVKEIDALLRAAERPLTWGPQGSQTDTWYVRLIPLPFQCSPPPGFDETADQEWLSVTPFVPPRYSLRRSGQPRPKESLHSQIARELKARGIQVPFEVRVIKQQWVSVHLPRRARVQGAPWGHRRGYVLHLHFEAAIRGPLLLGHSATFGLGLFRPLS